MTEETQQKKPIKVILRRPVSNTKSSMVFFEAKDYELDGQLLVDIQWLKAEVKRLRLEIQDLRTEMKKTKLF